MNRREKPSAQRRTIVAAGALATASALLTKTAAGATSQPKSRSSMRMPTVYLPHGGGPWPFVDLGFDRRELDQMSTYMQELQTVPKAQPKALLLISAHWEESVPTVMTSAHPPMLYDYNGFPPEAYQVKWPAPGDPKLAARVQHLLSSAGIASAADAKRGFDHGTFVPLKLTYPKADIPTIQLSLKKGLDPQEHLAMGRALAPLRDEGVFIIGSGSSFHNMRGFRDPKLRPDAVTFDTWLSQAASAKPPERDRLLAAWETAPAARIAHPREEHLLPLMVVAGAAEGDIGRHTFAGGLMGFPVSGYQFG